MSQCLKNLKPIQHFNFGAVCVFAFLSTLLFSLSFASSASALSSTITNPSVIYSRWYTSVNSSPAISSNTGELKQIPFRIITGGDTFLVGSDNWFSVDSNFLELTTYEGEFGYWYSSISGGDVSNCSISIRSTTGNLYHPNCSIVLNEITANGGPVRYRFTGSMPTNEGIQRVDFRVGYVDCTNVNQCIPLSAGPVSITDFSMTITSTASSSTTAIVNKIDSLSQQITTISGDLSDIKANQQALLNSSRETTAAVRAQTQQQHDDYENEVEREEAKEEELNEQKDDLNLSAQATANPFANLFNFSGCVNMPTVGGWFNNPNLRVCSPYPSTISGILNFVGSAVICGFLIRIYYKHMQGGFNG